MAKLYGIGVGPGSEELLTVKAVNILKNAKVVIAPSSKNGGDSIALQACEKYINKDAEKIVKHFPMGKSDREEKIYNAFKTIEEYLQKDQDVVFLTIGDPFVYSTYIYLLEHINEKGYETETVPGITSFCAAASLAGEELVIGDEPLLILPSTRLDSIKDEKYVVIMKLYNNEEKVLNFLEERNFKYICVRRAYREGQQILRNREEIIENKDYMSLIIANRE
ncbi:cobalt-factor II C(20)-methyltransferase [Clostridium tetani]|uniref:Cobalt-precorrin-2 C(20)-methyltransferase n=2 Tax=Clostridium tetani TaxID=1513 RepID=Q897J9_CLOTE|nr:cobalt-factor II C(20)-methyltransferase [Clostridium tetani]AAO35337.1 precorrin-2 C20-methyltransferase [Clostridium tetani E88]AVP55881.1 cobalt-factor II C(20)-methyltransferase [Clostridium tetani]KGI40649.1 cobalt-precorrin-2 C(20)-methyltransferase [Clostridium tetani ATCC 9441]KGI41381.1 cobalt-precorrin-2 C(20)-methyltransferase [Clostridium tetani]KGI42096.1 cobalt-precorrin-2 C(20)-methyltransferase [Clostridium tetani]